MCWVFLVEQRLLRCSQFCSAGTWPGFQVLPHLGIGVNVSGICAFTGAGGLVDYQTPPDGVVLAAGWGAVVIFILAVSPDAHVRGMLFWLMGDFRKTLSGLDSVGNFDDLAFGCVWLCSQFESLVLGELRAESLGVIQLF
ncbi:MAG: hypothetical protein Ct9H300mP14_02530 [Gammaproteobacteria bacterium]|nr:MAG: hypothetical protein Ct9H300mP14_02530 [Gammaproteobacteria bacterium]